MQFLITSSVGSQSYEERCRRAAGGTCRGHLRGLEALEEGLDQCSGSAQTGHGVNLLTPVISPFLPVSNWLDSPESIEQKPFGEKRIGRESGKETG